VEPGTRPAHERTLVIHKERVGNNHVRLLLDSRSVAPWTRPGQFVHVLCPSESQLQWMAKQKGRVLLAGEMLAQTAPLPLLRRPLSVYRLCGQQYMARRLREQVAPVEAPAYPRQCNGLELLFRVVGPGTQALADRNPGETVDLLGPLGNGFTIGPSTEQALLVAGGIGVAPLLALAQELRLRGRQVTALVGALDSKAIPLGVDPQVDRSFSDLGLEFMLREFDQIGVRSVLVSEQEHGMLVTEYLGRFLEENRGTRYELFACGPKGMLAEVTRLAGRRPCQVLLEERMACGVGACRGCVVKVRNGRKAHFRSVCKEGPVFRAQDVIWDELD